MIYRGINSGPFLKKEKKVLNLNDQEIAEGINEYSKNYPGQEKQVFDYFKNNPSEIEDCSEGFNRATFAFNQGLDKAIFRFCHLF